MDVATEKIEDPDTKVGEQTQAAVLVPEVDNATNSISTEQKLIKSEKDLYPLWEQIDGEEGFIDEPPTYTYDPTIDFLTQNKQTSTIEEEFNILFHDTPKDKQDAILSLNKTTLRKIVSLSLEYVFVNVPNKITIAKTMKNNRQKKLSKKNRDKLHTKIVKDPMGTGNPAIISKILQLELITGKILVSRDNLDLAGKLSKKDLLCIWAIIHQNWRGAKIPSIYDFVFV